MCGFATNYTHFVCQNVLHHFFADCDSNSFCIRSIRSTQFLASKSQTKKCKSQKKAKEKSNKNKRQKHLNKSNGAVEETMNDPFCMSLYVVCVFNVFCFHIFRILCSQCSYCLDLE